MPESSSKWNGRLSSVLLRLTGQLSGTGTSVCRCSCFTLVWGEGRAQRGDGGGRRAGPCAESPGRPRDGLDSAWLTVLDSDLLLSA